MALAFAPATKHQAKLRLAIPAPTGGGKTWTALTIARALVGPEGRIAVIDTEHGSASKYAGTFTFDALELDDFHPDRYVEAIKVAEQAGYDALIIDSASHEWNGHNGCLELVDFYARRSRSGNNFAAWADVTPLHNKFIEAILAARLHIIATFRSKMDYLQTEKDGKKAVVKVGMAPVARDGVEYEFDVVMEMDVDHVGSITKTRCAALDGKFYPKPGQELAEALKAWLTDGAPAVEKPAQPEDAAPPPPTDAQRFEATPYQGAPREALAYLGQQLKPKGYGSTADVLREMKAASLGPKALIGVLIKTLPDLTGGAPEPPPPTETPAPAEPPSETPAGPVAYEPSEEETDFYGSRASAIEAHERAAAQSQQPALAGA